MAEFFEEEEDFLFDWWLDGDDAQRETPRDRSATFCMMLTEMANEVQEKEEEAMSRMPTPTSVRATDREDTLFYGRGGPDATFCFFSPPVDAVKADEHEDTYGRGAPDAPSYFFSPPAVQEAWLSPKAQRPLFPVPEVSYGGSDDEEGSRGEDSEDGGVAPEAPPVRPLEVPTGPPIKVSVVLVSGALVLDRVELELKDAIGDLLADVEESVGKRVQALVGPSGIELEPEAAVFQMGLRDGDVVTALLAHTTLIYSTSAAFAAVRSDGSLVSWGDEACGGDAGGVQGELSGDVLRVYSSERSFAALKRGGRVVAWGDPRCGGDCSSVTAQLASGVLSVSSTRTAHAALKGDGSVVTWGSIALGGGARWLSGDVVRICATRGAFAALRANGSVLTWGDEDDGGDSSGVQDALASDVSRLYSSEAAFAAVKGNGAVVTWGSGSFGGDSSAVEEQLRGDVEQVFSNKAAFCAVKRGGSVVAWGLALVGGDASAVKAQLQADVRSVHSTRGAFAAIKDDGSVVTWGASDFGGTALSMRGEIVEVPGIRTMDVTPFCVREHLKQGVVHICSTEGAFAALKDDGSVIAWGSNASGGDCSPVQNQLAGGVRRVYASLRAFAAVKDNGSVVTWGSRAHGGDISSARKQLTSGVEHVYATWYAFAAVKTSGSVVTWGDASRGGGAMPATGSVGPLRGFKQARAGADSCRPGATGSASASGSTSGGASGGYSIEDGRSSSDSAARGTMGVVIDGGASGSDCGDNGGAPLSLGAAWPGAASPCVASPDYASLGSAASGAASPNGLKLGASEVAADGVAASSPTKLLVDEAETVSPLRVRGGGRASLAATGRQGSINSMSSVSSQKRLTPEEMARQSDAFWAHMAETLEPAPSPIAPVGRTTARASFGRATTSKFPGGRK